jgi:hypothetical protein
VAEERGPATPDRPGDRRLGEDEVAAILRRASLVEARTPLPTRHDPTADELARAAGEVGIDPALVRRAARIRRVREGSLSRALFGAEECIRVTTWAPGPVPTLREALVRAAEISDPEHFVWNGGHTLVRDTVIVEREGTGTSIEVRSDRMGRYLLFWGVAFVALATASASVEALRTLGAFDPLLTLVLPAFLPVLAARPFWRRAQHRALERVELLVMELARLVDEEDPVARSGDGVEEEPEP